MKNTEDLEFYLVLILTTHRPRRINCQQQGLGMQTMFDIFRFCRFPPGRGLDRILPNRLSHLSRSRDFFDQLHLQNEIKEKRVFSQVTKYQVKRGFGKMI